MMELLLEELRHLIWISGMLFTVALLIARYGGEDEPMLGRIILAILFWPISLGWHLGKELKELYRHPELRHVIDNAKDK